MSRAEVARAKAVCATCPVRRDCLLEALATGNSFGVWGGLSSAERARAMITLRNIVKVMRLYDQGVLEKMVVRRR
jgi:hypothetical protein